MHNYSLPPLQAPPYAYGDAYTLIILSMYNTANELPGLTAYIAQLPGLTECPWGMMKTQKKTKGKLKK